MSFYTLIMIIARIIVFICIVVTAANISKQTKILEEIAKKNSQ